jgi:hypothetical protein
MPDREPDFYSILNLSPEATAAEIQDQFRRLAKVFHPDLHGGDPWFEQQLKRYSEAYFVLSDPERKRLYDERRRVRRRDGGGFITSFSTSSPVRSDKNWSFQVPANPRPSSGAAAPEFSRPTQTGFSATFAGRKRRGPDYYLPRLGIVFLGLAVFGAALCVIDTEGDLGRPAVTATDAPAVNSRIDIDPTSKQYLAMSRTVAMTLRAADRVAIITPFDETSTDDARRAQSLIMHRRLRPYWNRFVHARRSAEAEIAHAARVNAALDQTAMDSDDLTTEVRSASMPTASTLQTDSAALQDQIDNIQSEFDDLHYESADEDVDATIQELDQQLSALEKRNEPLYRDLDTIEEASSD